MMRHTGHYRPSGWIPFGSAPEEMLFQQKIKFKITVLTIPLLKKGITELS